MVCHIHCHVTMSVATVTCDLCAFPTTHQYQPTWQHCHIWNNCATLIGWGQGGAAPNHFWTYINWRLWFKRHRHSNWQALFFCQQANTSWASNPELLWGPPGQNPGLLMGPNPESKISSFWDPPGQNPEPRASNPDFQGGPPELPKGTSKPEAEQLLKFLFWISEVVCFSFWNLVFETSEAFLKNFRSFSPGGSHNDFPGVFSILAILGRLQKFF